MMINIKTVSKTFSNVKGYAARNKGKLFLLVVLAATLNVFKEFRSEGVYFNFPVHINNQRKVEEQGIVEYRTEEIIEFENNYKANETIERDGSMISITGDIEGQIDPALSIFLKNRFFYSKIDTDDINAFCKESLNPIYPVLLRRLNYYMPKTELFSRQKWTISFCNGGLICDYDLNIKKVPEVSYFCSGDIDDNMVTVKGAISVNSDYSGFVSSRLEVAVSTDTFVSKWLFKERVQKK